MQKQESLTRFLIYITHSAPRNEKIVVPNTNCWTQTQHSLKSAV